jgi:RNA-binding protein
MANSIDTILYIGKAGIIETTAAQFEEALTARELLKAKCLEASPVTAREAAQQLAERVNADIVQVIGSKFVLYKKNPENTQIVL